MFGMAVKTMPQSFNSLESAQLHCAMSALRIQHALLGCLFAIFIALYFYNPVIFFAEHFPLWMTASFVLLCVALLIEHFFLREHDIQSYYKSIFIYFSSSLGGIFCALSYYTINLTLSEIAAHHIVLIGIIIICATTTHLLAILFLTYNYKHFLSFIIPCTLPLLHFSYTLYTLPETSFLYQVTIYLYLIFIFFVGYLASLQRSLDITHLFNLSLLEQRFRSANLHIDYMNKKIQEQQARYDAINEDMNLNQVLMEQKINERTIDIKKINEKLERSHQNLELAHETAGIASWDWDIQNRCIETGNFVQLFGYNIQSVNYYIRYLDKFIHPDDIEHVKLNMRSHLRGYTDRYDVIYRVCHKTEGWIWIHDLGRVIQRNPDNHIPIRMVGIRRNIDKQKKTEERLTLSANVLNKMEQGIFVLDDQLCYIDANPYFLNLIGLTQDELMGRYIFEISKAHTHELRRLHSLILDELTNQGEFTGELIEAFKDDNEIPLWIHINSILDQQQKVTQYIGIVTNLTERKNAEKKLSYLKNYDPLTDLPNRNYFNTKLFNYVSEPNLIKSKLAVIRINLDRFRYYNELLNQNSGDVLLKEVAMRLRRVSANAAVIARLNADDFAVILEFEQHHQAVQDYCNQVIQQFDEPFKIQDQEFIITISIGIAIFPEHGRQMDSLNRHAEIALLDAKHIGGNAVRMYHNEKCLPSEPRLKLESELRKAIQNNELTIFFQPQINCHNNTIYGFEALVRWHHPEHGILSPAHFIPLAEETSLISDIGTQVLDMACAQIKQWNTLGINDLVISVNIVVQQICRGHLIAEIDELIEKYQINPAQLKLEITETSLMENNDSVREVIEALHQRQIKIALDDFGIGYSSLSYLADYAFDVIKIDRSFVNGIGNPNKEAIIRAIIAMGKAMNKSIIAEGIETQAHYDFLVKEGCDCLQGYLIGKPMSADMATSLLTEKYSIHSAKLSAPK